MVALLGDMIKGISRITNITVWAISKFAHILTHLEGQIRRPVSRVHEGGKINILNKKYFVRSTDSKFLRIIEGNSINVI